MRGSPGRGFTPLEIRAARSSSAGARRALFLTGFTMIEVVVMLAIVTAISAVILVNFGSLREGGALRRSAQQLALDIRRMQNMALAVTQIQTSGGPIVPLAVGIRLERSQPNSYVLFADVVRDNKYVSSGPSQDPTIEVNPQFVGGVAIRSLTCSPACATVVHIIFSAPEASMVLTDGNGSASVGDSAEIELSSPSGLTKKVKVRTSGQVSIQ